VFELSLLVSAAGALALFIVAVVFDRRATTLTNGERTMQLKEFQTMVTEILGDQAQSEGSEEKTPRKWYEELDERLKDMVADCESEGIG